MNPVNYTFRVLQKSIVCIWFHSKVTTFSTSYDTCHFYFVLIFSRHIQAPVQLCAEMTFHLAAQAQKRPNNRTLVTVTVCCCLHLLWVRLSEPQAHWGTVFSGAITHLTNSYYLSSVLSSPSNSTVEYMPLGGGGVGWTHTVRQLIIKWNQWTRRVKMKSAGSICLGGVT